MEELNLFIGFQVTGDSIYNLTRLGEIETDKSDRPLDPPKIISVEVGRAALGISCPYFLVVESDDVFLMLSCLYLLL